MTKHILDTRQFKDRQFLIQFFDRTDDMARKVRSGEVQRQHEGRVVGCFFYQPSTRTRMSFEAAAQRVGASVVSTENAREFSSAYKGETLEHSFQATENLYDAFVIRHPENGAARRAAAVVSKPVINAGDGTNQHPTQALLDLYTIRDHFGRIDDLRIAFVGDIANGRTIKSLAYLLAHLQDHRIFFVAPEGLKLPDDMRSYLTSRNTRFQETDDLDGVLPNVDVLYDTRLQWEYEKDEARRQQLKERYRDFQITAERADKMHNCAILMHPLPINTEKSDGYPEIVPEVDNHPRAHYFKQSGNGLYVRMALLDVLLKPDKYVLDLIHAP